MPPEELSAYLSPTRFIDSAHESVRRFALEAIGDANSDPEKARRLFLAVRDAARYNPYAISADPDSYRASATLAAKEGFCVTKAILLAAALRAVGVPCRLGFADVTNHLATERLVELMGTNVFAFHGFCEVWLAGRWIKATPTFNASLCEKFGVDPLVFDGEHDAVFHPYDRAGHKHMEYLRDRGRYADFPMDEMLRVWREAYPKLVALGFMPGAPTGGFEGEAAAEQASKCSS